MLFFSCLLFLATLSCTYAVHPLNVLSNIIIDDYGGRHPIIRIGKDNLPFMIWESDSRGAIGIAHCDDIHCKKFNKFYLDTNETLPHIGYSHANQVFMRISPYTGYPQILYSLTNASNTPSGLIYYLRFVTCFNYDCSQYHICYVLNEPLFNNGNNIYVYFVYTPANSNNASNILISYNEDPNGLFFVKCMNITCDKNTNYGPYSIFPTYSNTGWYNSMYILSNARLLFMYYNNDTFSLDYAFYDYKQLKTLQIGSMNSNVHGGWLSTTNVSRSLDEILISRVYVDIVSGDYMYGLCNVSVDDTVVSIHCVDNVIDTNISDDPNDYDLFVYPDIVMHPSFNEYPITAYFHVNALKIAQCDNLLCDTNTYIQQLTNGSFGYGRDAHIEWYQEYNLLYISFLDFNSDGNDKKARVLICEPSA